MGQLQLKCNFGSRASTDSSMWGGARCAYRIVVLMLECPSSFWTVAVSAPPAASREARVPPGGGAEAGRPALSGGPLEGEWERWGFG